MRMIPIIVLTVSLAGDPHGASYRDPCRGGRINLSIWLRPSSGRVDFVAYVFGGRPKEFIGVHLSVRQARLPSVECALR